MMEMRYQRDEKQCCEKVKKLTLKYKRMKDENSRSEHGKTVREFMAELDNGTRPTTCPANILDSMPDHRSLE